MKSDKVILTLTLRGLYRVLLVLAVLVVVFGAPYLRAQKVQDTYKDALKVTADTGGVSLATSADGRYVYVAGKRGLIVSDDYGKTGSWVQTLRMK